jgi:hypothetical protein
MGGHKGEEYTLLCPSFWEIFLLLFISSFAIRMERLPLQGIACNNETMMGLGLSHSFKRENQSKYFFQLLARCLRICSVQIKQGIKLRFLCTHPSP